MATPDGEGDLDALLTYLRDVRGFDFTGYKRPSLSRRITKRMQTVGADDYQRYLSVLEANPGEFVELFNTILINVTGFLTPVAFPLPHLALIHQRTAEIWRHDRSWLRRRLGPALEPRILSPYRNTPFVTVSRTTLADLRAQGWRGPGYVAFNGVETGDTPGPRKEPSPTLVFLARLGAPGKRLEDALAVHRRVSQEVPDLQLWVIGRGTPPRGVPDGVRFFSGVDDALRDDLLARAWILIATSVREGWGRMVLEAAACGTPCAVYGTPGLAEAAQAVEGITTVAEPQALAAAVLGLLRAPDRLTRAGARARHLARGFSWERAADVWESALATTAAGAHWSGSPVT